MEYQVDFTFVGSKIPHMSDENEIVVFYESGINFCFECGGEPEWDDKEDNNCYLCGPDHSPLNGEANYMCRVHLDKNVLREYKVM